MNVRGDTPSIAAACASVIRPVAQTRNARNSALPRALPPSPALLARHRRHRHRCLPDDVVPFLRIGLPHIVHSLASDDFPLPIRQAQQEHVFRKSQAGTPIMLRTQNHPATRLTAVGISGRIKHTFCHLTPCFHGSLSPMYRFGVVLPVPHPEAIFKNRGFPTFPLGDLLRESQIPVNSHTARGRTDTNHGNPSFLPYRPQIVGLLHLSVSADNESHLCIGGVEGH